MRFAYILFPVLHLWDYTGLLLLLQKNKRKKWKKILENWVGCVLVCYNVGFLITSWETLFIYTLNPSISHCCLKMIAYRFQKTSLIMCSLFLSLFFSFFSFLFNDGRGWRRNEEIDGWQNFLSTKHNERWYKFSFSFLRFGTA